MSRKHLLIIVALAMVGIGAADDDLSDFTNDLATDLGPLLALFGESMTRQYLSEIIRVCGHPFLRAFIGRSQESAAIIEAELCTSTSRDVCELFSKGGITRALGRPRILELVYKPLVEGEKRKSELNLFRRFLQDPETTGWRKRPIAARQTSKPGSSESGTFKSGTSERDLDLLKRHTLNPPNLSLNLGIVKQPAWVFYAGTLIMCAGIWGCAFLIGETTQELCYERTADDAKAASASQLIWLQPKQVIGDQNFDSFAYIENTEKGYQRIETWTASEKNLNEIFGLTSLAVLAVLVGYIMHFIGLRGMEAWVSLAQMIVTVIMSILRGLLRIQRLDRNANLLADKPDLIQGHELDWLAFEVFDLTQQKKVRENSVVSTIKDESLWVRLITATSNSGRGHDWPTFHRDLLDIRIRLADLTGLDVKLLKLNESDYVHWEDDYVNVRAKAKNMAKSFCSAVTKLMHKYNSNKISNTILFSTTNLALPVEVSAGHLFPARNVRMCLLASDGVLASDWIMHSADIEAVLGLTLWILLSDARTQKVASWKPYGRNSAIKTVDSATTKRSQIFTTSSAEDIVTYRIISARHDGTSMQRELDFWLGRDTVRIRSGILSFPEDRSYGLVDLWETSNPSGPTMSQARITGPPDRTADNFDDQFIPLELTPNLPGRQPYALQRFCGWISLAENRDSWSNVQQSADKANFPFQYVQTTGSLLEVCAQELFATLVHGLYQELRNRDEFEQYEFIIDAPKLVDDEVSVRNQSPAVEILAEAFQNAGLGSRSDALLCIIPVLGPKFRVDDSEHTFTTLTNAASRHRRHANLLEAESLLQYACVRFAARDNSRGFAPDSRTHKFFLRALRATGDLYRWSFVHGLGNTSLPRHMGHSHLYWAFKLGTEGIKWMRESFRHSGNLCKETKEILQLYGGIAERLSKIHDSAGTSPQCGSEAARHQLLQALRDQHRENTLYQLCFVGSDNSPPEYLVSQSSVNQDLNLALIQAVRNGWDEVVSALLEVNANPNGHDDEGRTPLLVAVENRHPLIVQLLLDAGADVNVQNEGRTLLDMATEIGAEDIARLLRKL